MTQGGDGMQNGTGREDEIEEGERERKMDGKEKMKERLRCGVENRELSFSLIITIVVIIFNSEVYGLDA